MDELIAFITARLDEDEATARDADLGSGGIWGIRGNNSPRAASTVVTEHGEFQAASPEDALHIASHDPFRVLCEVIAKRAILAKHEHHGENGEHACHTCHPNLEIGDPWPGWCPTLRLLAIVWADHPDYRAEEWAP
jgi:hypothetical protein